jgi:cell division protease FtsH
MWLPLSRQLPRPAVEPINVLLIAATNRADGLDPALPRPGRFDRRLSFDLPAQAGRRELVDHFLGRKTDASELDDPALRDALAGITQGYTPVMIEHLLDEALVNAVRRGEWALTWKDVEAAWRRPGSSRRSAWASPSTTPCTRSSSSLLAVMQFPGLRADGVT